MKKIAIYRYADTKENREYESVGSVSKVQILPSDKTDEEITRIIGGFNSSQDKYVVSHESVSKDIADAMEFLSNNRQININRHLEALKEIKKDIRDIDDCLHSVIRDIKDSIKKDDE